MPVLMSKRINRSDLAVEIAKALLKDYDYNEGQLQILANAFYTSKVYQMVEYDIEGDTWEISSDVDILFDISVSHPEAVDETLYKVIEEVKQTLKDLFESEESVPRGSLGQSTINRNANYYGTLGKVGLFR